MSEYSRSISDNDRRMRFIRRGVMVLLITAIAWQAAGLTWKIIGPVRKAIVRDSSPVAQKSSVIREAVLKERASIAEIPLFGISERATVSQRATQHENAPVTSLALLLKGIVKIEPANRAMAVISEKAKPNVEKLYGIGETVPGNAIIDGILFDRVILRRGGVVETLLLYGKERGKQSPPVRAAREIQPRGDGTNWQIDRSYWNRRLSDIPSLAKEIGVEIFRENNIQKGYRLLSARGSKLLRDLGLQPGDILHEVNGVPLNSVHDGLAVYQQMANATEVRVTISRDGKRESRVYRIGR